MHDSVASPSHTELGQLGEGSLQMRVLVPATPHSVAEQTLQVPQMPGTGAVPLQACSEGPVQLAPVPEGAGLVQVRVCMPVSLQAVTEQADQALQSPSTLHAADVHCCVLEPGQISPPQPGAGLSQVRV